MSKLYARAIALVIAGLAAALLPILDAGAGAMTGRRRFPCAGDRWHRGKRRFDSETRAAEALSSAWARSEWGPGPLPCRVYRCQCGHWHLSTKAAPHSELGEVVSDSQPTEGHAHARVS